MITDQRRTLGVFMNKGDQNFQDTVQDVVRRRARELNYDVFFFLTVGHRESSNFYDEQEKSMFSFAPVEHLDGILVTPDTYDMHGFRDSLFQMLDTRAKCPVVCVRDRQSQYDSFYTDESVSIRPLMQHLLEDHGFRNVCFLAGYKEHPDSNDRLACYMDEMEKHGIPLPANAIHYGTMWSRGIAEAYAHFFSDPQNWPEAVVCANDYMAHALIDELHTHGYRVPGDVVVTGFDDIIASSRSIPTLTTVGQDYVTMVTLAMDHLHQRILAREQGIPHGQSVYHGIPGALSVRESCGCAVHDENLQLNLTVQNLEHANRQMGVREVSQTYFAIEINSADSYEDVHNTIVRKLDDIPSLRDFYLCMFHDESGFARRITPQVQLISSIRDRQDCGMPMLTFDREHLLPDTSHRDEPQVFYVCLLHQRHSLYGYTIIQFQENEGPSQFYLNWNVTVSIALRNLDYQGRLKALYEERRMSSITDELTGLSNRRGVNEQLDPIWKQMCEENRSICFVAMDMDNLKPINDTMGHQGGDEALRTIANGIRAAMPGNAIAARIGGDEYLVVIPDCDQAGADAFCSGFARFIAEHNRTARFPVGASVGAKLFRLEPGMGLDYCVNESDHCMYHAKQARLAELDAHARFFGKTRRG